MPYATPRHAVADTGVATIALDQPGTRNALSDELLDDLIAAEETARFRTPDINVGVFPVVILALINRDVPSRDALFRQQDTAFAGALEYLHAQLSPALATDDIPQGVRVFFEKRDPVWTGR